MCGVALLSSVSRAISFARCSVCCACYSAGGLTSFRPSVQNFKGSKLGDDYSSALPAVAILLATVSTPIFFFYFLAQA